MSTIATPPVSSRATADSHAWIAPTVTLHGVSWETYVRLCTEVPGRMPHSYDDGVLELMTHSFRHSRQTQRVSRLLDVLTEELNIPKLSVGAMTLRDDSELKGVEPDGVFWIAGEAAMRSRQTFDPETDPPPDLVIETEIGRTVLDRLSILAAFRVSEVWRSSSEGISVLVLTTAGAYEEAEKSRALPFLTVADLSPFLVKEESVGETARMREFRRWVRKQFADLLPESK